MRFLGLPAPFSCGFGQLARIAEVFGPLDRRNTCGILAIAQHFRGEQPQRWEEVSCSVESVV